ncbi:MAG: hypothetical protein LBO03_04390 [Acidaminococcales bacterium]|jgi:hypothetical protein|nr:hypothetical protein [Acidaminococcales bacterium]
MEREKLQGALERQKGASAMNDNIKPPRRAARADGEVGAFLSGVTDETGLPRSRPKTEGAEPPGPGARWEAYGKEGGKALAKHAAGRRLCRIFPAKGCAVFFNLPLVNGRRYYVEIRGDLSACRIVEAHGSEGRAFGPQRRIRSAAFSSLPRDLEFEFPAGSLEGTRDPAQSGAPGKGGGR